MNASSVSCKTQTSGARHLSELTTPLFLVTSTKLHGVEETKCLCA
jgi:hypothetical protein